MRAPERIERLVIIDAVPLLPGYRWHRVARVWRRRGAGELMMGSTTAGSIGLLAPDLKPRARVVAQRFDQGTQRAVLKLYRSAPEDELARAGARPRGRSAPRRWFVWGADDPYIPRTLRAGLRRRVAERHGASLRGRGALALAAAPGACARSFQLPAPLV